MTDHASDGDGLSRRDFLKTTTVTSVTAVTGTLLASAPRKAAAGSKAKARILGANDRVRYAVVGTKGMGGFHLKILTGDMKDQNVEVAAACDVWEKAREMAQQTAPEARVFSDHREMLDKVKDLDVVVVATPDHWHSRVAIDAMKAGCNVYCEKPTTRELDDVFEMAETARETGAIVQAGSQGCSDPKWLKAREVIQSGRLGKLLWAQGSYARNNPTGEWNYEIDPSANPSNLDWKRWLGPAPKRDWSPERYFRWRKFWDYGTGIIGDLWPHRLHPLMMAMGIEEFPSLVTCIGGDLCHTDGPDENGRVYGERREVADTTMMMAQFPRGDMVFLAGSTTNERGVEDLIRGQKANLVLGGGNVLLEPERPFVEEIERADETPPDSGENHFKHHLNYLNALRTNTEPSCPMDLAVRVQTVVSMAELSYRKGVTVHFDADKKKMRT